MKSERKGGGGVKSWESRDGFGGRKQNERRDLNRRELKVSFTDEQ